MGDRHRYPRPRSPVYNPARVSLPINLAGYSHPPSHDHHHHSYVVPLGTRHEVTPSGHSSGHSSSHTSATRGASSAATNAGTVTTTYKIKADPPARGSSIREGSHRRSTLESNIQPTVTATSRHRPVVHTDRPESPMKNPYRLSEEEYYTIPATSSHGHSHAKRYSATMDNADMNRLAREREGNRLWAGTGREGATYIGTRPRQIYPSSAVRRADKIEDDYGADGYGYTNPRDLVQYDLNNDTTARHKSRRDSFEAGRRNRPTSIGGYDDIVPPPRPYERERGPPPSIRGFDRILPPPTNSTWKPPKITMPVAPPPQMDPIQRPARMEPPFPDHSIRRSNSHKRNSMYQDRDAPRRAPRDDYYEVRDGDSRRDRVHQNEPRYDDPVEQRGFGIRNERLEQPERPERPKVPERLEKLERPERNERSNRSDDDRHEHKGGRDAIAAGISLAGAALGIKTVKNSRDERDEREIRDERDDRRRREYDDESRRHRDWEDNDTIDLGGRDPKERIYREDDNFITPPRGIPPPPPSPPPRDFLPPREIPPSPRDNGPLRDVPPPRSSPLNDMRGAPPPEPAFIDLSKNQRPPSRNERDSDPERRERRRHRSEASAARTDSRSDSSASETAEPASRRESRTIKEPGSVPAFNPKNTMDLRALKEALNSKENAAPKEPTVPRAGTSITKDPREAADIRDDLSRERPSREPLEQVTNRQTRVVSPPREKAEEKPVKSILRAPREKFPEDPTPIREGVAPLKDAKKDGVPPDARWTKISRKLVNPEALELGKERYEAREDFVIVLRVLSRDEVQGYAEVTQKIRATREEDEELEARDERRRARRERHERHKRERIRGERSEHTERPRRRDRESESDTTNDEEEEEKPRMLEAPPKKRTSGGNAFENVMMSGGLGDTSTLRENPEVPGQYLGYRRNPPPPSSMVSAGTSRRESNRE